MQRIGIFNEGKCLIQKILKIDVFQKKGFEKVKQACLIELRNKKNKRGMQYTKIGRKQGFLRKNKNFSYIKL